VKKVAIAADSRQPADHPPDRRPARSGRQRLQVAGGERRRFEVVDAAHGDGRVVEPGADADLTIGQLAVCGRRGHAHDQPAPVHECDLRREHRVLADEGLGAVDGVHDPHVVGVHCGPARFLAVETVVPKPRRHDAADDLLRLDVSLGHRRLVGLDRDLEVAQVVTPDHVRRGGGRLERGAEKLRVSHGVRDLLRGRRRTRVYVSGACVQHISLESRCATESASG
jgi:hypothetical protein